MSAEEDLYAALVADSDVTDLVATKIYSDFPDEDVSAPFVFYERTDTEMIHGIHSGIPMAEIAQLVVICYADTREAAESIGDKVVIAADAGDLVYVGRQGEYDDESKLFAAVLQLQHNK